MEGAPLALLPDTDTDLIIKLKLVWEWSSFANKYSSSTSAHW